MGGRCEDRRSSYPLIQGRIVVDLVLEGPRIGLRKLPKRRSVNVPTVDIKHIVGGGPWIHVLKGPSVGG